MGRKIANSILTALLLIGIATVLLLCGLGVIAWSNVFVDGWWVIFIIIPLLYGVVNDFFSKNVLGIINSVIFSGDLIFLFVAVFVLRWSWGKAAAIFGAVLLINIALRIIFSPFVHKKKKDNTCCQAEWTSCDGDGEDEVKFGAKDFSYAGREFTGTELNVAFGASKLDLSTAEIVNDAEIKLEVAFGGVEIILPAGVSAENRCSSFCGGVNIRQGLEPVAGCPTVILTRKCSFGGVEVKRSKS